MKFTNKSAESLGEVFVRGSERDERESERREPSVYSKILDLCFHLLIILSPQISTRPSRPLLILMLYSKRELRSSVGEAYPAIARERWPEPSQDKGACFLRD